MDKDFPKVGIGVWIFNSQGQVLMMKRQGSHGAGTWAPPGGNLEMGESFLDCAKREVKEETDLDIDGIEVIAVTNDVFDQDKHYVTPLVKVASWQGEAKIMEPNKCTEIGWYDFHNLPKPLFLTIEHMFEAKDFKCLCGSGKSFKNCPNKGMNLH